MKNIINYKIKNEEKDNTIEFNFENKKIEVPKTGNESKIKLFAGAVILSLLGIVYIVVKNIRKVRDIIDKI